MSKIETRKFTLSNPTYNVSVELEGTIKNTTGMSYTITTSALINSVEIRKLREIVFFKRNITLKTDDLIITNLQIIHIDQFTNNDNPLKELYLFILHPYLGYDTDGDFAKTLFNPSKSGNSIKPTISELDKGTYKMSSTPNHDSEKNPTMKELVEMRKGLLKMNADCDERFGVNNKNKEPVEQYDGYQCPKCGRYMHPVETHSVGYCTVCDPIKFDAEVKKQEKKKDN